MLAIVPCKHCCLWPHFGLWIVLAQQRLTPNETLDSAEIFNQSCYDSVAELQEDYFAWTLGMDGSELINLTGSTRGKSVFLSVLRCMSTLPLQ